MGPCGRSQDPATRSRSSRHRVISRGAHRSRDPRRSQRPLVRGKQDVYNYVLSLGKTLARLRSVLVWNRPLALENPVHNIEPGDEVYIKTWNEEPLKEKWTSPHQFTES
ncbi:uncharacterized protein LOC134555062 isoform X2 [Prinia subflava]|uniref:uncharacterized protein LOC134555062 isoform X2 n=1 Tax=Prinia subflava TaxID=208062 RepID=UPI002FE17E2C